MPTKGQYYYRFINKKAQSNLGLDTAAAVKLNKRQSSPSRTAGRTARRCRWHHSIPHRKWSIVVSSDFSYDVPFYQ